jgi:hypothetical protein
VVPDLQTPPTAPLERRYLIGVFRASSGEPVNGAQVEVFNTPPGRLLTLDELREMLEGPYGKPYVMLLAFKLSCFGGLLTLAVFSLVRGRTAATPLWLKINLVLGLLALAAAGVLGYLHILSHGHSF